MLTDYDLLVMAVEENPDFLNTAKESYNWKNESQEETDLEESQEETDLEESQEETDLEESQEETDLEESQIDYSDILNDMNNNLVGVSSSIIVLDEKVNTIISAENGLLNNTYYFVYFMFGFFIFGALCLVIKFFKQFF